MRNWFGMIVHPFKTIRAILRDKDYSQMVLVFTFPIIILFSGLATIWFSRRLVGVPKGVWGFPTKSGVTLLIITTSLLFSYLGYWILQVLKVKKNK